MKTIKIDVSDIDTPIGLHCTQLDFLTNNYKVHLESLILMDGASDTQKEAKLAEAEIEAVTLPSLFSLPNPIANYCSVCKLFLCYITN
jgi:hypothetical protein